MKSILYIFILTLLAVSVSATQLGVNYYHESLFTAAWNQPHSPRGEDGARADLDHIKEVTNNIKFFMHPFVDENANWVDFLVTEAENRGMHTVVTVMVDDRQLDNSNWGDYANRVRNLCTRFNGKADEFLVGNEIVLHSPFDKYEVKNRISQLISDCESRFSGDVSYQEFWYAKEAWYNSNQKLYWMQYEPLSNFETNVGEMVSRFGQNGHIGEWGEDSIDEGTQRDDWWQRVETEKRWNVLEQKGVPTAYIFTYSEPSWNAFGIVDPNYNDKPVFDYLKSLGQGGGSYTPPQQPQQPVQNEPEQNDPAPSNGIASYPATCNGGSCNLQSDTTSGTCRTVTYSSIKFKGCMKGSEVEVYKLSGSGEGCIGGVCVSNSNGYGRGTPFGTTTPSQPEQPNEPEQNDPSPSGDYNGIGSVQVTCQSGCSLQSDVTLGVCRTVKYSTNAGTVQVMGCEKGNDVELYVQQSASNFEICFANGCVNQNNGFARFTPNSQSSTSSEPQQPVTVGGLAGLAVYSNPAGTKTTDSNGGCRTIAYSTSAGNIQAQICDKGGHYEMYRQSNRNGAQICVGSSCVGSNGGFATISK